MSARTTTALVGTTTAAALAVGLLAAPAAAAESPATDHHHRATRSAMDATVRDGTPGVIGRATDRHGTWSGTSGVGDLETGDPRGTDERYRTGSVTKTFVATVLLQLEAEGSVDLDDTVERRLPGLVRGHGHDGGRVTIRQLLNHTSGIYDYLADDDFARATARPDGFFKNRYVTWSPEQLVAIAMRHRPDFTPGTDWRYSNTNYLLAGLIIERATGRPYGDEVRRRIIEPLGLHATTLPGTDPLVPRPSSRAYSKLAEDATGPTYDVTEFNPSSAWADGELISTAADLNRFYSALLRGRLLPERQLAAMKTTVPVGEERPGASYGLGLSHRKLSCGRQVWGHSGGILGSVSDAVTTEHGGHSFAFNLNGDWNGEGGELIEAEYCGK
ncbi:class A beta-lactamase-related serine hydrolase [Streptomyces triticagri]|uniref:Class A beta-lactamase-related serine hydrolase n=1 Tax=Streptomyces triticagri TaxID=2293568 RepID=A0A372MAX5_9ACTN|nr:serine hydrolase domain-containing protein [Streptomyces triticagri]RFU88051.1 class A beta-lactamase-related serine hydrolase [Streptomyces triticagri]